ncbi:MAG: hypothetical protein IPP67_04655 [Rhodospirillaceae bacterium]|nr:hypothetical protein [Rhodospirillaceae bacterium]
MTSKSHHLNNLLASLSERSMSHVKEFKDTDLGVAIDIHNPHDMKKHVIKTLYHPDTKSFGGENNRDFFYNKHTNTSVILNPNKDHTGNIHGGAVFRPSTGEQRFHKLHEIESGRCKQNLIIHEKGGIVALRPGVAREFARKCLGQTGKDFGGLETNPAKTDNNLTGLAKIFFPPKKTGQHLQPQERQLTKKKAPVRRRAR